MAHTDIDVDGELVAEVMRRYGLTTTDDAVDLALRRLVGPRLTTAFLADLGGIGWVGDLDKMRGGRESPHR